ncbi:MAG: hypothetical protein SFV24_19055 [Gemmatimonadales bacterium]|nr:hypothetical protein [Gemmatimonadales bacterium]
MDELDELKAAQQRQETRLNSHGERITAMETTMKGVAEALKANTEAINAHTKVLSEYSGARKALNWLVALGLGIAGFILGHQKGGA